jgi:hypothetical protein
MRTPRLLLALAVTGMVLATGAGAAVSAAQPKPCGDRIHNAGNDWQSIRPNWTTNATKLVQVVAVPYAPDTMYATNGLEVMVTNNGGCSWSTLMSPHGGDIGVLPPVVSSSLPQQVADLLKLPSTARIVGIAAPSSATSSGDVYVAYNDEFNSGLTKPHIISFTPEGTFDGQDTGLPSFGTVGALELSASGDTPTTAYTVIDGQLNQPGGVYITSTAGKTWEARDASATTSSVSGVRADPVVNDWAYAQGSGGLIKSADGGKSFQEAHSASDMKSFDVAQGHNGSMLVVGHADRKEFDRLDTNGGNWQSVPAPVDAQQVAIQPILGTVTVSDGSRMWLESNGAVDKADDITPDAGPPTQTQITAPLANGYAIVGNGGDVVLRRVQGLNNIGIVGSPGRPVLLLPHGAPKQFPSTLTPGARKVSLPAGASQDVSYRLLLPRTPSPVDIMFLVDTTASTENTINGLKQDLADIVNDIGSTGLNAQFGLADFKDYSSSIDNLGAGDTGDYPYRLDRRIGPADVSLRAALNKLRARGGGDPPEAQLTALYQSTTGIGQHYPGRKTWINGLQPGQSAGYRGDALKLAVLATDERFHQEKSYLTPSWDKTVAALRSYDVHPIGLAVETVTDRGQVQGFHSLAVEQKLARATGSIAPAGGVDCNGDLVPDVAAGDAFVCKVPVVVQHGVAIGGIQVTKDHVLPVKLAAAITRAAETLPDLRTVGLQFPGIPASVAHVVTPAAAPQVNLKNDNALNFTVRYTCPTQHKPQRYKMHVNAAAGARVVASSPFDLACGAVPAPQHNAPPPIVIAAPAAAAAAPPPPGQPIPNTNPNPNPGLNANVGFASQEEEQRQLAFAGADQLGEEDTTVEYQMSRLSSPSGDGSPEAWFVGGAAVLLTGAAGFAARSRFAAAWHRN